MPVKKGHTNNPNGRPKGSGNKVSPEIKQRIQAWCIETLPELFEAWANIDKPELKVSSWAVIAEYGVPKQARQEIALSDDDDSTTGIKVEIVRNAKND
jgi:hypothetical protein